MAGWQVDFGVLVLGAGKKEFFKTIQQTSLIDGDKEIQSKIIHINELELIEDVFSTLDFKKYILQKREGITEKNSDYILTNNLSRRVIR